MKASSQGIRVLVTGVGGGSVGHQVLHALQLCGDQYDVTVVDADAYSFGLYTEAKRFVVPLASAPGYIGAIRTVVQEGRIQVVIPGTEAELKVLSAHRAQIEELGALLLVNPPEVVELCQNKHRMADWLKENGFDTPETVGGMDWAALVARTGFPIIAKPFANSSGSRNVALLASEEEIARYLSFCCPEDTIFQEVVDDSEGEFTVGVCLNADSKVIDSIAIRRRLSGMTLGQKREIKGRTHILSTGYSQGFVVRESVVQEACERLTEALGMQGPANIQCRLSGGRVMVFEVHPRFSGTTSLRADVGFNEPDLLIRTFLYGEKPGRQTYRTEVAVIRSFQAVVVPMAEMDSVPRIG